MPLAALFSPASITHIRRFLALIQSQTTRAGWTIGGGLEFAVTNNWSVRAEYRYSDFGTFNNNTFNSAPATFVQHHETENVAAGMAAETVKKLLVSVNRKRRCFLRMKRTQSLKRYPGLLQADVIRNHPDNVGSMANRFGEIVHS